MINIGRGPNRGCGWSCCWEKRLGNYERFFKKFDVIKFMQTQVKLLATPSPALWHRAGMAFTCTPIGTMLTKMSPN